MNRRPPFARRLVPLLAAALLLCASLPAFALGGIDASNLGAVVEAGAKRVAVASAIAKADDPEAAAHRLRSGLG